MTSPFISKRDYFLQTFASSLEKLNEAVLQSDDAYFTENGEVVIHLEEFPEFAHQNIREYLVALLKEGGWEAVIQENGGGDDFLLLY